MRQVVRKGSDTVVRYVLRPAVRPVAFHFTCLLWLLPGGHAGAQRARPVLHPPGGTVMRRVACYRWLLVADQLMTTRCSA